MKTEIRRRTSWLLLSTWIVWTLQICVVLIAFPRAGLTLMGLGVELPRPTVWLVRLLRPVFEPDVSLLRKIVKILLTILLAILCGTGLIVSRRKKKFLITLLLLGVALLVVEVILLAGIYFQIVNASPDGKM